MRGRDTTHRTFVETLETRRLLAALPVDVRSEWAVAIEPVPSETQIHSLHAAIGDGAGNIYVGGYTNVPGWVQGGYDSVVEDIDGFVAKYDASGARLWSTYLGGVGSDLVSYLVAAPDGSVYVAGQTILTSPEADWIQDGQAPTGRFLAHLSQDGALIYAHWFSIPFGVVSFADSSMYAYERHATGGDPVLANRVLHRELLNGEAEWSTELGTDGATISDIQVHYEGGVYVTLSIPDDDGSAPDAALLRISPAGETLWSVQFEDAGGRVKHLADDDGTVYAAWNAIVDGVAQADITVSRISATGELLWNTAIGKWGQKDPWSDVRLVRYAPGGVYLLHWVSDSQITGIRLLSDTGGVITNMVFALPIGSAVSDDNGSLYLTGTDGNVLYASRFDSTGMVWAEEIGSIGNAPKSYVNGVAVLGAEADVYVLGSATAVWASLDTLPRDGTSLAFMAKYAQITTAPEQQVTGLEAFVAFDGAMITWGRTPDASSYEVWRATDDPATATKIATTTKNMYIDPAAEDEALSYYWIRPVNNVGAGPMSEPVSIRVYRVPAAPQNVQATTGLPSLITISWDAVQYADSYQVRIVNGGTTQTVASSVIGTSYTYRLYQHGMTFNFVVVARNGDKYGSMSEPVTGSTLAVPAEPVVTVSRDLVMRLVVSWEPSLGAESYEVWAGDTPGLFKVADVTGQTSYELTYDSVVGEMTVYVRVVAVNAATGVWSDMVEGLVIGYPPVPELSGSFDRTDIRLQWTADSLSQSYEVWRSETSDLGAATRIAEVDGASDEYFDTDVVPGRLYYYWMRAIGEAGSAGFSARVTGYPVTRPLEVSGLAASHDLGGAVALQWTRLAGLAEAGVSYELWRSEQDDPEAAALVGTAQYGNYIDTSAAGDVEYYYWVRAVNAAGAGPFSASVTGVAVPKTVKITLQEGGGWVRIRLTDDPENMVSLVEWLFDGDSRTARLGTIDAFIIHGSSGSDHFAIENGVPRTEIYAGPGNDTIYTSNGDDLIYGGDGNDMIASGTGNDTIYGNFGADTISAGLGNDIVYAGLGRDSIVGGEGDDTLLAGNGADVIRGGAGHDHIEGRGKADTLYGGAGNDTIVSGAGADVVFGEDGDDVLYATAHTLFVDELNGGAGHDRWEADENDVLSEVEELLG